MALIGRRTKYIDLKRCILMCSDRFCSTKGVSTKDFDRNPKDDEFKPLRLMRWEAYVRLEKESLRRLPLRHFDKLEKLPARSQSMPVDQHWPSVWPVAASFRESVAPLPLYQGSVRRGKKVPGKFGNLELMKIPNFLHLTPPAVKGHCHALKQFCTAYPEALKQNRSGFPLAVVTSDYCHSGPSLRDPKARIVTFRIKLSDLQLNPDAQEKMKRLLEHRYNGDSDAITITTDSCPLRKQNFDYAQYLLTALYHESHKEQPWENEKNEDDWLVYRWQGSRTQERIRNILKSENSQQNPDDPLLESAAVASFGESLTELRNRGLTKENIENYKRTLRTVLRLDPLPPAE